MNSFSNLPPTVVKHWFGSTNEDHFFIQNCTHFIIQNSTQGPKEIWLPLHPNSWSRGLPHWAPMELLLWGVEHLAQGHNSSQCHLGFVCRKLRGLFHKVQKVGECVTCFLSEWSSCSTEKTTHKMLTPLGGKETSLHHHSVLRLTLS